MARRVQLLKAPYDHYWKQSSAMTVWREPGTYLVKDEVAEAMIAKGYAIEVPSQKEPTPKPKVTRRRSSRKKAGDENPNPSGRSVGMDRAHLAPADSADGVAPLADAG